MAKPRAKHGRVFTFSDTTLVTPRFGVQEPPQGHPSTVAGSPHRPGHHHSADRQLHLILLAFFVIVPVVKLILCKGTEGQVGQVRQIPQRSSVSAMAMLRQLRQPLKLQSYRAALCRKITSFAVQNSHKILPSGFHSLRVYRAVDNRRAVAANNRDTIIGCPRLCSLPTKVFVATNGVKLD